MDRKSLSPEALDLIAARFKLLGEPSRLKLLIALEGGAMNVSELVEATSLTQANVSRHLGALTEGGILMRRRDGLNMYYEIDAPEVFELCESVCGSLQKRLDSRADVFRA